MERYYAMLKNIILFSFALISFSSCLGFEPMIRCFDDWSDGHHSSYQPTNTQRYSETELYSEYAELIDNAIIKKQDLNTLEHPRTNEPLLLTLATYDHFFNNLIKKMLDNGANIEVQSILQSSPLVKAIRNGHLETVKFLLQLGANTENNSTKNNLAERPLIEATRCSSKECKNNVEMITLLLTYGAYINIQGQFEQTALHAVFTEPYFFNPPIELRQSLINILIAHGADLYIKNNCGKTPLDLAKEKLPDLVPVMLQALYERNFYGLKKHAQEKIMPTLQDKRTELIIAQLKDDVMMHTRIPAFKYLCN